MRRKFTDRVTVTVYMERAEYDSVCSLAGGQGNLSAWARERLLAKLGPTTASRTNATEPAIGTDTEKDMIAHIITKVDRKRKEVTVRAVKTCEHGTAKNYYCGMCGGKAKIGD